MRRTPVGIDSDLGAGLPPSPGGFLSGQPQAFIERYANSTFLRRMANDCDLGGPVVFLLSEPSQYVTGVNIPVDGGYTAH